jgi:hypothetical protein
MDNAFPTVPALAVIAIAAVLTAFVVRVVVRKLHSPNRTLRLCLNDALFEIPYRLRILNCKDGNGIDEAMAFAMKQTGLTDFGKTDPTLEFAKRYRVVETVGITRSKMKLSPAGFIISRMLLRRRMTWKLNLNEYLKRHPLVEKQAVRPPIFVIGFPRTGTTFLHELLCLHEKTQCHYMWEQLQVAPAIEDESLPAMEKDRRERYRALEGDFKYLLLTLWHQRIQSIHRVGYDEIEECTTPLADSLPLLVNYLPYIPFAGKEVIEMGAGDAYHRYKKILQLLTWQSSDRRGKDFTWMLKCPFHLPYLRELNEAFPGSTLVWTHRNPAECVASACVLYEAVSCMCCEESSIDKHALGAAVMSYTKLVLQKAEETILALGDKLNIIHVRFKDVVKQPKNVARDIIERAGLEYTASTEASVDGYLERNASSRLKQQRSNNTAGRDGSGHIKLIDYKLEDYGLTDREVRDAFAEYIAKYNL